MRTLQRDDHAVLRDGSHGCESPYSERLQGRGRAAGSFSGHGGRSHDSQCRLDILIHVKEVSPVVRGFDLREPHVVARDKAP